MPSLSPRAESRHDLVVLPSSSAVAAITTPTTTQRSKSSGHTHAVGRGGLWATMQSGGVGGLLPWVAAHVRGDGGQHSRSPMRDGGRSGTPLLTSHYSKEEITSPWLPSWRLGAAPRLTMTALAALCGGGVVVVTITFIVVVFYSSTAYGTLFNIRAVVVDSPESRAGGVGIAAATTGGQLTAGASAPPPSPVRRHSYINTYMYGAGARGDPTQLGGDMGSGSSDGTTTSRRALFRPPLSPLPSRRALVVGDGGDGDIGIGGSSSASVVSLFYHRNTAVGGGKGGGGRTDSAIGGDDGDDDIALVMRVLQEAVVHQQQRRKSRERSNGIGRGGEDEGGGGRSAASRKRSAELTASTVRELGSLQSADGLREWWALVEGPAAGPPRKASRLGNADLLVTPERVAWEMASTAGRKHRAIFYSVEFDANTAWAAETSSSASAAASPPVDEGPAPAPTPNTVASTFLPLDYLMNHAVNAKTTTLRYLWQLETLVKPYVLGQRGALGGGGGGGASITSVLSCLHLAAGDGEGEDSAGSSTLDGRRAGPSGLSNREAGTSNSAALGDVMLTARQLPQSSQVAVLWELVKESVATAYKTCEGAATEEGVTTTTSSRSAAATHCAVGRGSELLYWVLRADDYSIGRGRIVQSSVLLEALQEVVGGEEAPYWMAVPAAVASQQGHSNVYRFASSRRRPHPQFVGYRGVGADGHDFLLPLLPDRYVPSDDDAPPLSVSRPPQSPPSSSTASIVSRCFVAPVGFAIQSLLVSADAAAMAMVNLSSITMNAGHSGGGGGGGGRPHLPRLDLSKEIIPTPVTHWLRGGSGEAEAGGVGGGVVGGAAEEVVRIVSVRLLEERWRRQEDDDAKRAIIKRIDVDAEATNHRRGAAPRHASDGDDDGPPLLFVALAVVYESTIGALIQFVFGSVPSMLTAVASFVLWGFGFVVGDGAAAEAALVRLSFPLAAERSGGRLKLARYYASWSRYLSAHRYGPRRGDGGGGRDGGSSGRVAAGDDHNHPTESSFCAPISITAHLLPTVLNAARIVARSGGGGRLTIDQQRSFHDGGDFADEDSISSMVRRYADPLLEALTAKSNTDRQVPIYLGGVVNSSRKEGVGAMVGGGGGGRPAHGVNSGGRIPPLPRALMAVRAARRKMLKKGFMPFGQATARLAEASGADSGPQGSDSDLASVVLTSDYAYYRPYMDPRSPTYRRILCATYTYHKKIDRAWILHATAAHLCDKHLIFTDKPVAQDVLSKLDQGRYVIVALNTPGGEDYMNMWQKTRMILDKVEMMFRGYEERTGEEGANTPDHDGTRSPNDPAPSSPPRQGPPQLIAAAPSASAEEVAAQLLPHYSGYDHVLLSGDDVCLNVLKLRRYLAEAEELYGVALRSSTSSSSSSSVSRCGGGGSSSRGAFYRSAVAPIHTGYGNRDFVSGATYLLNRQGMSTFMSASYEWCHPQLRTSAEDVAMGICNTATGLIPRHGEAFGLKEDVFNTVGIGSIPLVTLNVSFVFWLKEFRRRAWPRGGPITSRDAVVHHFCSESEMSTRAAEGFLL